MEKYENISDIQKELLKNLAIFAGLKIGLYLFIAWAARAARKAAEK